MLPDRNAAETSDPMLYDPTIHQKHRKGEYQPLKKPFKRRKIIFLPPQ
jgi:hypothetical protein